MSYKKINIAVAGATGYVGLDLIKFLSKHPNIKIQYLSAQKKIGKKIQYFDKRIKGKLPKNLISTLGCSDKIFINSKPTYPVEPKTAAAIFFFIKLSF